jgi:hypothetical protein
MYIRIYVPDAVLSRSLRIVKLTNFLRSLNTSRLGSVVLGASASVVPLAEVDPGSISSVVRNDSDANSVRALVIVNSVSNNVFCSAFGVPLRSSTCVIPHQVRFSHMTRIQGHRTFWKFENDESPISRI